MGKPNLAVRVKSGTCMYLLLAKPKFSVQRTIMHCTGTARCTLDHPVRCRCRCHEPRRKG